MKIKVTYYLFEKKQTICIQKVKLAVEIIYIFKKNIVCQIVNYFVQIHVFIIVVSSFEEVSIELIFEKFINRNWFFDILHGNKKLKIILLGKIHPGAYKV